MPLTRNYYEFQGEIIKVIQKMLSIKPNFMLSAYCIWPD